MAKLLHLESIRGLAALSVVIYHLALAFFPTIHLEPSVSAGAGILQKGASALVWGSRFVYDDGFPVILFFVLSGFVLSWSYLHHPDAGYLSSAALRRYFRLVWPSLVSILIAYALMTCGFMANHEASTLIHSVRGGWLGHWFNFPPSILGALREGLWSVIFQYDFVRTYNCVLWTMSVEFYGSLVVYATLGLCRPIRNRGIVYLIAAAVCVLWAHNYTLSFILGLALAEWIHAQQREWKLPGWSGLGLIVLACLLVSAQSTAILDLVVARVRVTPLIKIAAALLIITTACICPAVRIALSNKAFVFLGKISFGLYLIHMAVLCSIGSWVFLWLHDRQPLEVATNLFITSFVVIVVSILGGWLMVYIADRPSIWIGRYVYATLFKPGPERAPSTPATGGPTRNPRT